MSIEIPDAVYCPDIDSSRVPGGIISMSGFAPLQRGQYGSVSTNDVFEVVSGSVLNAFAFRAMDNTVRVLLCKATNVYEYQGDGTEIAGNLTANASTTGWSAAAWGDSIFICNKLDDTMVSDSSGQIGVFAAVGDDCPKARFVAANLDFVMLADTNDGSDDLSDRIWWSALQDPTEWTPSIATQAGNNRLLDVPGPITALRAFRDGFVVAKRNCLYWGEYIGPPFVFQWRLVSSRIGVVSNNAIAEIDDKLIFVHDSGIFQWDGATLINVGLPVWQTILNQFGYAAISNNGDIPSPGDGGEGTDITALRFAADDVDGVVWLGCYTSTTLTGKYTAHGFGYNARTQKWSQLGSFVIGADAMPIFVNVSSADMRTFLASNVQSQARVWYVNNKSTNVLRDLRYPDAWDNAELVGSVVTATHGGRAASLDAQRLYARCLYGSSADPFASCTVAGYANEQRNAGAQTATFALNSELDCWDGRISSRYRQATLLGGDGKQCLLAGIGFEYPRTSGR